MATRRYRIHFICSFDQVVLAADKFAAQKIAIELEATPTTAIHVADDVRCRWNTIELVECDAD